MVGMRSIVRVGTYGLTVVFEIGAPQPLRACMRDFTGSIPVGGVANLFFKIECTFRPNFGPSEGSDVEDEAHKAMAWSPISCFLHSRELLTTSCLFTCVVQACSCSRPLWLSFPPDLSMHLAFGCHLHGLSEVSTIVG